MTNTEYLEVLCRVAGCLRDALHHDRIEDLTPEQVIDWLHHVTPEDLSSIWQAVVADNHGKAA